MQISSKQIPDNAPEEVKETVFPDKNSPKEEESLSKEKFQQIQKKRHSDFKKHVHWVSIGLLYILILFYIVAGGTWLWHLIFPENWHFMPENNYNTLQNLLFGTIVGGLVSQFARRVFSDD